jgi:hypothetical protein
MICQILHLINGKNGHTSMVIINCINTCIITLLYLVYRTTPVEYNFNYSYQLPSVKLPVVKAGLCSIHYTFNEPLPVNDLQTLYVVAIRPSIISIDSERRVKTSYHTN